MCSLKMWVLAAVLVVAVCYPEHGHGGGHDGGFGGHGGFGGGHGGGHGGFGGGHGGHGGGIAAGHGGHGGGHGGYGGGIAAGHGGHGGGHGGYGGHDGGHGGYGGHDGGHDGGHGGGHGGADYYAAPHYQFEYKVHDPHTHDIKSQHETREGDKVKGYYTLKEADGTLREVHYEADHKNGFNAVVKRTGQAVHPAVYGHHEEGGHGGGHGHH